MEMDFLDISSLSAAYRYLLKFSRNLIIITKGSSGMQIHNNQRMTKMALTTVPRKPVQDTGKEGSREDKEGHRKMV
jgi:hypothetical protein